MTPFTRAAGRAVVLDVDNIDTDQLLPARFLKKPRASGYDNYLFHDLRRDADGAPRPDFPLNRPGEAPVFLAAGDNFGCGSSREGAVYALVDAGIRAVFATGFADIFRSNAVRNGLVPVVLSPEDLAALKRALADRPDGTVAVDLEAGRVEGPDGAVFAFEMDAASRRRLLLGLDDIAETAERMAAIEAGEADYRARRPWALPANG